MTVLNDIRCIPPSSLPAGVVTIVFSWLDTRDARPEDAQAIALRNDGEQPPAIGAVEALLVAIMLMWGRSSPGDDAAYRQGVHPPNPD
jgi:hypothetical protein